MNKIGVKNQFSIEICVIHFGAWISFKWYTFMYDIVASLIWSQFNERPKIKENLLKNRRLIYFHEHEMERFCEIHSFQVNLLFGRRKCRCLPEN